MSVLTFIAMAAIVVVEEEGSPRSGAPISVPRAGAVVIDGTLEETEWSGSTVVRRPEGDLLLRHDGKYLYIGIRAARRGFPSVCFARGESVRVVHASFALGDVVYERTGAKWRLGAPFTWEPLARPSSSDSDQRRARFLAEHGWIGSTVPMGNPHHAEMQIALDQLDSRDPRISVAFFMEDSGRGEEIASWARTGTPARDGCANDRLVRGYAPQRVTFRKAGWMKIRLASRMRTLASREQVTASDSPLAAPCRTARRSSIRHSSSAAGTRLLRNG